MFKRYIAKVVQQEIDKRFTKEPLSPPVGYNSLDKIRGAMFQWLPVPFAGDQIWCKCRTLNKTQIDACGQFSILTLEKENKEAPTTEELIDLRNTQEALIRATLLTPTYEKLEQMIYGSDHIMADKKKRIEELEKETTDSTVLSVEQKIELDNELQSLRLFTAFVLPEDTFGFLTAWALGCDISDIKKIARKQLYNAAILAMNGKDNPSDHISGILTDRDKEEINIAAELIYQEIKEFEEMGGKRGMKWIGGPKNKE